MPLSIWDSLGADPGDGQKGGIPPGRARDSPHTHTHTHAHVRAQGTQIQLCKGARTHRLKGDTKIYASSSSPQITVLILNSVRIQHQLYLLGVEAWVTAARITDPDAFCFQTTSRDPRPTFCVPNRDS